jgi:hypothetical protein
MFETEASRHCHAGVGPRECLQLLIANTSYIPSTMEMKQTHEAIRKGLMTHNRRSRSLLRLRLRQLIRQVAVPVMLAPGPAALRNIIIVPALQPRLSDVLVGWVVQSIRRQYVTMRHTGKRRSTTGRRCKTRHGAGTADALFIIGMIRSALSPPLYRGVPAPQRVAHNSAEHASTQPGNVAATGRRKRVRVARSVAHDHLCNSQLARCTLALHSRLAWLPR